MASTSQLMCVVGRSQHELESASQKAAIRPSPFTSTSPSRRVSPPSRRPAPRSAPRPRRPVALHPRRHVDRVAVQRVLAAAVRPDHAPAHRRAGPVCSPQSACRDALRGSAARGARGTVAFKLLNLRESCLCHERGAISGFGLPGPLQLQLQQPSPQLAGSAAGSSSVILSVSTLPPP